MKKAISILGCGWLGEPLAKYLISHNYQIKGSTTSKSKLHRLRSAGILSFIIKLESINSTILAFLDAEILIVNVPSKNIEGFKNLIAQIENSSIKKVVLISSTSVYANSTEIITEQAEVYPSELVEIESLFSSNPNFSSTILRFGGLFGYHRNPGRFFPKGKPINNPEGYVNMIHRDDCVGIISQLIKKDIWNEIFNACADSHPKRREFYTKAALDIGLDIPEFHENQPCEYKIISNQKLKSLLAYDFKFSDLLNCNEISFDSNI